MTRLNIWQGLWVVASCLWIAYLALNLWGTVPTESNRNSIYAFRLLTAVGLKLENQLVAEQVREKWFGNVPDEQLKEVARRVASDAKTPTAVKVEITAHLGAWDADLRYLPELQKEWWGPVLVLGLVPPTLLYLVGLLIAWVRRGFKQTPSE